MKHHQLFKIVKNEGFLIPIYLFKIKANDQKNLYNHNKFYLILSPQNFFISVQKDQIYLKIGKKNKAALKSCFLQYDQHGYFTLKYAIYNGNINRQNYRVGSLLLQEHYLLRFQIFLQQNK